MVLERHTDSPATKNSFSQTRNLSSLPETEILDKNGQNGLIRPKRLHWLLQPLTSVEVLLLGSTRKNCRQRSGWNWFRNDLR